MPRGRLKSAKRTEGMMQQKSNAQSEVTDSHLSATAAATLPRVSAKRRGRPPGRRGLSRAELGSLSVGHSKGRDGEPASMKVRTGVVSNGSLEQQQKPLSAEETARLKAIREQIEGLMNAANSICGADFACIMTSKESGQIECFGTPAGVNFMTLKADVSDLKEQFSKHVEFASTSGDHEMIKTEPAPYDGYVEPDSQNIDIPDCEQDNADSDENNDVDDAPSTDNDENGSNCDIDMSCSNIELIAPDEVEEGQGDAKLFESLAGTFAAMDDIETADEGRPKTKRVVNKYVKKDGRYVCNYCENTFASTRQLKIHLRNHTGEKPFCCDFCGNSFKRADRLRQHRMIHLGIKPYKCDYCGRSFRQRITLRIHQRRHTGEKPFHCDICNRDFAYQSQHQVHMLKHTGGDKPFVCRHCKEAFSSRGKYEWHVRKHTGAQPIRCPMCDREFGTKSVMIEHMRGHTGERPFVCQYCAKQFARRGSLVNHVRSHLTPKYRGPGAVQDPVRQFTCQYCGKGFISQYCANRHIKLHLGIKPFACDKCDLTFTEKSILKQHERTHEGHPLEPVPKLLDPAKRFTAKRGAERKYTCQYCGKGFTSEAYVHRHVRTHTGEKPHECQICGCRFAEKHGLKCHLRVHAKAQENIMQDVTNSSIEMGSESEAAEFAPVSSTTYAPPSSPPDLPENLVIAKPAASLLTDDAS